MALGRSRSAPEWRRLAVVAVERTVALRGGAVVWPEVEGLLAQRDGWADENIPELRDAHVARIDPHHLAVARRMLLGASRLQQTTGTVGGRDVATFVDANALRSYGRKTAVTRAGLPKFVGIFGPVLG